jgi:type I restriction enzyme S subunit
MSDNFISTTIEEACEIHDSRRKPIKKGDRIEGKYPYYGASGIADYIRDYEFDGTYLLLSEDGDNLKTQKTPVAFLAKGKFWVNNHAHVLKAKEGNLTEYICYALQVADIKSYISGSTRPKITQSDMRMIPFNLPPLPEQKAIAHILGTLDDKIELNRQMNQTLEAMAQALFKSWFVDFDPVIDNALAAGNQIPEALQARAEKRKALLDRHSEGGTTEESPQYGAPLFYSNPALSALFPSSFEYNETLDKWIPEGWEVKKLNKLVSVKYGKDHKKLGDGNFPCYGSGGLMRHVEEPLYKEESVLIPRKGTLNNIMYVNHPFWSVDTMFYTMMEMEHFAKYFFYTMNRLNFDEMNEGSAVPSMTTAQLNGMNLLVPDSTVLQKFDETVAVYFNKKESNKKLNKTLTNLRDTLLPQLISGKVRVPEEVIEKVG